MRAQSERSVSMDVFCNPACTPKTVMAAHYEGLTRGQLCPRLAGMPRTAANGIEIEYDTFGDANDPALLLVMGFTAQLIAWDERFCRALADRGFHVIRFDNRDCGLSTKLDGVAIDMEALMAARDGGPMPAVPYTLSDMSDDGFGLLSALGVDRAHIVGASMGGMIVQTM